MQPTVDAEFQQTHLRAQTVGVLNGKFFKDQRGHVFTIVLSNLRDRLP